LNAGRDPGSPRRLRPTAAVVRVAIPGVVHQLRHRGSGLLPQARSPAAGGIECHQRRHLPRQPDGRIPDRHSSAAAGSGRVIRTHYLAPDRRARSGETPVRTALSPPIARLKSPPTAQARRSLIRSRGACPSAEQWTARGLDALPIFIGRVAGAAHGSLIGMKLEVQLLPGPTVAPLIDGKLVPLSSESSRTWHASR
jgi:hypothetical protein